MATNPANGRASVQTAPESPVGAQSAWRLITGLLLIFCLPIGLGLIGILLPAAGFFPALGQHRITTDAIVAFLTTPGLGNAIFLTLWCGMLATAASLLFSFLLLMAVTGRRSARWLTALSGPLVTVPHAAIAIGLLFLLTPSGWLMRILSPEITGFVRPPIWGLVPDPHGWGLIIGLMAKEIPFLCLVGAAALATIPVAAYRKTGASLGYGRVASWIFLILPLLYRRIRLPIAAVLVFSLSVVDMALILGPGLPPPLAVLVYHGFIDADLTARLPASAGACLQVGLVLFGMGIWRGGEYLCGRVTLYLRRSGHRFRTWDPVGKILSTIALTPALLGVGGVIAAGLWSVAGLWRFPDAWPATFSLRAWAMTDMLLPLIGNSLLLGIGASMISLALVLLLLRLMPSTATRPARIITTLIYIPLLVPQVSFLFGLQLWLSWFRLDGTWIALLWVHAIFILPYGWLILRPAYGAIDPRLANVAASLGASPWGRFIRVTLPLMAAPIGTAFFVGIAVSAALYLPTLFAGAGRIDTLTTEAVSLASGGNRSLAGAATIALVIVPISCFILIQGALRWRFGRFAGMRGGHLR